MQKKKDEKEKRCKRKKDVKEKRQERKKTRKKKDTKEKRRERKKTQKKKDAKDKRHERKKTRKKKKGENDFIHETDNNIDQYRIERPSVITGGLKILKAIHYLYPPCEQKEPSVLLIGIYVVYE